MQLVFVAIPSSLAFLSASSVTSQVLPMTIGILCCFCCDFAGSILLSASSSVSAAFLSKGQPMSAIFISFSISQIKSGFLCCCGLKSAFPQMRRHLSLTSFLSGRGVFLLLESSYISETNPRLRLCSDSVTIKKLLVIIN